MRTSAPAAPQAAEPERAAPQTGAPIDGARQGILAFVLVATILAIYILAVGTDAGLRIDGDALAYEPTPGTFRHTLALAIRALNPLTVALGIGAIALLARGDRRVAIFTTTAVVGASVASARLLEQATKAIDPFGEEGARQLGAGFFPSGHAAGAMALALSAVLLARDRWRAPMMAVAPTLAAVLGVGNLVKESHLPSDVLAGFCLAGIWALASCALLRRRGFAVTGFRLATLLKCAVVGAAIVVALLLGYDLERPSGELPWQFFAAAALIAVCAWTIPALVLAASSRAHDRRPPKGLNNHSTVFR